ncbi:winged helix-turn-helix domain-containing protein [Vibrio jasicida]|uniref:winged helix-turn-helix domain-containing protein n=1 Tax=Vibrio jasicida TaxID=766224 RepID=UPI004068B343
MRPQKIESLEVPIGNCTLLRTETGAELLLGNSKSFSITIPESSILHKLVKHQGEVVEKDDLILEAWGSAEIIGPNSLPVAITNLRKVLEFDNIKILNVPKKGYRINIPERDKKEEGKNSLNSTLTEHVKNKKTSTNSIISSRTPVQESIAALFFISILFYFLFYCWLSWVSIECKSLENNQICHIKGDKIDVDLINITTPGTYYYSSNSGLVRIDAKERKL